jgi:hypothetical protein
MSINKDNISGYYIAIYIFSGIIGLDVILAIINVIG